MTLHIRTGERTAVGRYLGFDHITFWVGNAKQAASYYVTRFGFEPVGYKGLETGSRAFVSHAVRQNDIVFIFQSSLEPGNKAFDEFASKHSDGVKDVAFTVNDCRRIWKKAVERGAMNVLAPFELKDEFGSVIVATVSMDGDVEHSFVERAGCTGPFLPGFITPVKDPLTDLLPATELLGIDHCVFSVPENEMSPASKLYETAFDFRRFFSVDDKGFHDKHSIRQSIPMADYDEMVKMHIYEPSNGKNSETQEFVKYNGGGGVQRVAFGTNDIIKSVSNLRARGVEFMPIPAAYYSHLAECLEEYKCDIAEPLAVLEQLGILVYYDEEGGYLLQIFSKPVVDRPTLSIEITQRVNLLATF
ncbi:Glyoxalase/Bleomycin resistance protein/Dihydroxybiphenyl dioxygenase [Chytriomyces cf. hyalinus JEL632]|nr:Glyoxalase/Bleomycin resistance protein/Dihydroxybiphenyl dioxygenase [Chytriomyces cf. hyalinus JEL632]